MVTTSRATLRPGLFVVALLLAEIATFIWVGDAIGVLAVLALVVGSAVLGVATFRRAGMRVAELRSPEDLPDELAIGASRLVAGLLLVLPGLLSSAAGLLLLVPALRDRLIRRLRQRHPYSEGPGREGSGRGGPGRKGPRPGPVIEGEFTRLDPRPGERGERGDGGSPWS